MESKTVVSAAKALQKYAKGQATAANDGKSQLFGDGGDEPQWVYLHITARKYFASARSTKAHLAPVPHSIWADRAAPSVVLFSRDPQRLYKDALQGGEDGPKLVDRVVGVSKLKGKFKPFEARRVLKTTHDLFIAEEDIIPMLPKLLGSTFFGSQFAVPIAVRVRKGTAVSVDRTRAQLGKILGATVFTRPASTLLSVRIGTTATSPVHIAANAQAVIEYIEEHFGDFGGFRALGIKTDNSPLLPVFYASELYDEDDIGSGGDEPAEPERAKRKREDAELDTLLADVVDEDEIRAYNREQRQRRRGAPEPEVTAETEGAVAEGNLTVEGVVKN